MAFTDNSVNSGSSGNSDNSDTTKDHMIQAGSCCPTEPKLEPNHHGVLQVLRQEPEAETEMEFVDDLLTNPDLVTQVRLNTMGINRLSRRKRGMAHRGPEQHRM